MLANSLGVIFLAAAANGMLTQLEKEDIVRVHNSLRGEVFPQASNMQKMVWDDQLSDTAQHHTQRCIWAPNTAADVQSVALFPEGVGENLAFSFSSATSSEINPNRFVHEWFAESAFYNISSDTCAPKETCKHYKQVVWSESHAIGCGIFTCVSFDFFGVTLPNATFFSCLYGAAGNGAGIAPYAQGTPCSTCPAHATGCEANLCIVAQGSNTSAASFGPAGPTIAPAVTTSLFNGSAAIPQRSNISAPPLVAMPPPNGVDVITEAPTTPEPTGIPSLLPRQCEAPATPTQREDCWRSAWLLWTQKYNQWASGQCSQPAGATASPANQGFPLL